MATITLYPTSDASLAHSVYGGSTAYGSLADNSDDTYIAYVATTNEEVKTSTFNIGSSNSISGRYIITGITVVSRTKKGYNSMDTASAHSNLYVGGIEGASWSLSLSTNWTNRSHTSSVSEFSNLNGKLLTALPGLVLHLQSTTKVSKTDSGKYVGFSRAYVTLTYDNYYSQTAQGSTGVSVSLSNNGTAVEGYYKSGTTTTYTATLSNGYGFAGWYTAASGGTLVSRSLTYSETCNSNRTLYARAFAVSAQGETGVTASLSRGSDGYTFTFTASMSSDQKYGFLGWYNNSSGTVAATSTDLSYTVELDTDTTLYAKVFTVSAVGETGVSAAVTRGTDGRTFTFNGTLDAGTSTSKYGFKGWYTANSGGSQLSTNLSYSELLVGDTTYYAKVFSVTANGSTGVSASLTRNSNGRTFTFNATLSDNYAIDGWYDGNTRKSRNVSYSTTLSDNTSYTAKAFTVFYDGDSGITVSASRGTDGKTYTFTGTLASVTSTTASTFNKWVANSVDQSETSLTLTTSIDANTTVTASTFTTTVAKDSGFSSATISRPSNTSVTVTGTLKNDYALDGWYNGNTRENRTLSYTKTISSSDTITAKSFSVTYSGDSGITVSAERSSDGRSYTFTGTLASVTSTTASTFNKWVVDGTDQSETSLTLTKTVDADMVVSASTFTTTVAKDSGFSSATISRPSNTSVTVSATLKDNYALDGWYNGNTRENRTLSYTKTISSSDTLTAKSFSVSWSGDSGITVSAERSSDGRSYTFTGTLASVTSTTASVFGKWSLNGNTVSGQTTLTYTLAVESNSNVVATSYTITVSKGTGANTVSISRDNITTVTISSTMSTGYDFDGWYANNVKESSTIQTTLSSITSSKTYTSTGVLHNYILTAVGDSYSSGTVTADNYHYGTTATFTATITNIMYMFDGWYNDARFTDLYSSSEVATYTITGDKTLYIKTKQKNIMYIKANGSWGTVPVVYRKENGVWVIIDPDNYATVFNTNVRYIKRDQ